MLFSTYQIVQNKVLISISNQVTMSRSNVKTVPIQKYCKVCHDAGKSESEYRSHCTRETRDPNSRVTCPTLLNLECRFCFKRGHTVKYCKILKEKNAPRSAPIRIPEEKPKANKYTNIFLCLDEEEEDKDVSKPAFKDEFPVLAATKPNRMQAEPSNYAAALSKVAVPVAVPAPIPAPIPVQKLAPWDNTPSKSVIMPSPFRKPMRNWADDTDSDDEEEPFRRNEIVDDNSAW